MKGPLKVNPPEREENVGFIESEEITWREYFVDFRTTVWPMLEAEGFTFVEAMMFWRQEMCLAALRTIQERICDE